MEKDDECQGKDKEETDMTQPRYWTVAHGEGFFVDGAYRSCRGILGRDWWKGGKS